MWFPDEYALNIVRLVNSEEYILHRTMSHDCHVFIQILIPIIYWDLLPKRIWDTLITIIYFLRDVCSNKLHSQQIEEFEKNIIKTICKLEMIFPPSFFDSIKNLSIHLVYEAKIRGLVPYKWMYPFERLGITSILSV